MGGGGQGLTAVHILRKTTIGEQAGARSQFDSHSGPISDPLSP
jgi:hypothetical protein